MSGQYQWTEGGLYICIRCGSGLEPGHNLNCRGKGKKLKTKKTKTKANKRTKDKKTATDLAVGFETMNLNDE